MSAAETSDAARPTRFGLAAKLFAILILLGAVAVLITGVLGYVRARDALEQTIFNQLTATRQHFRRPAAADIVEFMISTIATRKPQWRNA